VTFEEYVATRRQGLQRYAYLLTGDAHRAQDLVQTALLEAYLRWRKVSRTEHPDAYVRRIITNQHLRWHGRRWSREDPTDPLDGGPEPVATGWDARDPGIRVADRDQLRRVLTLVSPQQRAVLVLRYYEGYDDAAIARALDTSETTVRSQASRGLARLRSELKIPAAPLSPASPSYFEERS
jgi:RNA polymerase sigma-70 factor (sigma-E family)